MNSTPTYETQESMEVGVTVGEFTTVSRDGLTGDWWCRCSRCQKKLRVTEAALLGNYARCGCSKPKTAMVLPDYRSQARWQKRRQRAQNALRAEDGSVLALPTARCVEGPRRKPY